MNCDRCPHMKRILEALKPCQKCEAGKLHGEVSADASPVAERAFLHMQERRTSPANYVTTLAPDAEDALRHVLATIMQLDPVELLLLRHVWLGGKYHTFSRTLLDVSRRLRTKERELAGRKGGFRSLVNVWADKIRERLPVFGCILYRAEGDET